MAFVKLDCGMLNSTTWFDREAREVFITALLMAVPQEFEAPVKEIQTRALEYTGWEAPPGWYGFVPAAGPGIVRRAMVEHEVGMGALERLAGPDPGSRSQDFNGRRMIRIDGGFLVLNFRRYRDKDHTAAARSQRYRDNKASRHGVTHARHAVTPRSVTQAEAEAEVRVQKNTKKLGATRRPADLDEVKAFWTAENLAGDPIQFWEYRDDHGWKWKSWKRDAKAWARRDGTKGTTRRPANLGPSSGKYQNVAGIETLDSGILRPKAP